ncbi:MAG TPA: hypothetical protein VH741_12375, partial [Candidatus Limnocylindrales bacterium]
MSSEREDTTIESVDATYLSRVLRDAGYSGVVVAAFQRSPVGGKSHGGGALYRYRLDLAPSSAEAPATLILKTAQHVPSQSQDPSYTRRELDCYRAELFAGLGERLLAPRAYATDADADTGRFWIWMEDFGDAFDVAWTPELLAQALRDLAELHARWWGRAEELARMPFLRWRAQAMYDGLWVERIAANCAAIEGHPHERAIGTVFTPARQRLLARLSAAADLVYPRLERLPQTLLHQDAWLPNLGRRAGKTALIDWSYAGPGTPGAELSQSYALLAQMWGHQADDQPLLEALHTGLAEDWRLPISYDQLLAGYEMAFCLRPCHALGGPVLGGILRGRATMVGSDDLDERLAAAEAVFRRIERGVRRL